MPGVQHAGRRVSLREAFPWGSAPRYLLRDRDRAFTEWSQTAQAMDIDELVTAPRSPWQNAYVERFIGSVRRECLDHIIVCSQAGLRRTLQAYGEYYNDVSYCPTSLCA